MRLVRFAKQLGLSVKILRIGKISFGVVSLGPREHAIGAEVDKPRTDFTCYEGELPREQRVDAQSLGAVLGLRLLLDYADGVYDDFRSVSFRACGHLGQKSNVDASEGIGAKNAIGRIDFEIIA